jgi:pectate lyase
MTQYPIVRRVFSTVIACAMLLSATVARPETVERSNLFGQLWGFGASTTGGLGGDVYVVDRTDDSQPPVNGMLRYGVEVLGERVLGGEVLRDKPTWIVFHPAVFPPTTKTEINLTSPLRIEGRDNLTIDGRGSYVSLKRVIDECGGDDNIVYIRSSKNIIITHMDFSRDYPEGSTPEVKEECGDMLTIDNKPSEISVKYFDRIWINQSDFSDCGDECIGITHFSELTKAYVTISRNQFVGVNSIDEKAILLGKDSEFDPGPGYGIAVSLYQNRFYNIGKRLPRIAHGYLRAYNNVFENWESYGIAASIDSRVMIEQNVFRSTASASKKDAWEIVEKSPEDENGKPLNNLVYDNQYIWTRNNIWWTYSSNSECPNPPGGSGTGSCNTSNFPACSIRNGPWYYDCAEPMFNITGMSYSDALSFLRSFAGWKATYNDVRNLR